MELLTTFGPLLLGLLAWGLGAAALLSRRAALGFFSLGSCAASLFLVILYFCAEAKAGDVAAILDTADAFALCAAVLVLGTLALNGATLIRDRGRESARHG